MDGIIFYRIRAEGCCGLDGCCFSSLEEATKALVASYLESMKAHFCGGCRYCCYGVEAEKERCERRFYNDSELPEYLTFLKERYPRDLDYIEKVLFAKGHGDAGHREEIESFELLDLLAA